METVSFGETDPTILCSTSTSEVVSGGGATSSKPLSSISQNLPFGNQPPRAIGEIADCNYPANIRVTVSQRERLQDGNIACVANVPETLAAMVILLRKQQCIFIHYGHEDEFRAIAAFAARAREQTDSKLRLPVVASTSKPVPKTVPLTKAATAIKKGFSVIFAISPGSEEDDVNELFNMTDDLTNIDSRGKTHEEVRAEIVKLKQISVVFIFDRCATFILGETIQDTNCDKVFLDDKIRENTTEENIVMQMTKSYARQTASQKKETHSFSPVWQTYIESQPFRNAFFPSTINETITFPLDVFGIYATYHPFGATHTIAVGLLDGRGEDVRDLLVSWMNYWVGTPNSFISNT